MLTESSGTKKMSYSNVHISEKSDTDNLGGNCDDIDANESDDLRLGSDKVLNTGVASGVASNLPEINDNNSGMPTVNSLIIF